MKAPIISIIVPVYNVEDVIERCVNSLISQTYQNIEIILIDDGSPDNSPEICDDYAKKDSRITVIHKTNGGLSAARNTGIFIAKGKYVLFVDSDDYIELDTCEKFETIVNNCLFDIVIGGGKKSTEDNIALYQPSDMLIGRCVTGEEFLEHELKNCNISMAAVLHLYRREFLIDNELFFEKGLLHEDEYWSPRVILCSNNIFVLGYNFYNYIIRSGSITTQVDFSKNAKHITYIVEKLSEEYSSINNKHLKVLLNDYLVGIYLFAYRKGNLHQQDKKYTLRRYVLTNSRNPINRLKSIIFFISPKLYILINNIKR